MLGMRNLLFLLCCMSLVSYTAQSKERKSLSITFAGDVTFSGYILYLKKIGNCTYNESFTKIVKEINTDFFFLNLESSIGNVDNPPNKLNTEKPVHLISEPESIKTLKYLKVDAVAIANNHMLDYGEDGIIGAVKTLQQYNIGISGLNYGTHRQSDQKPIIFTNNGVRIGILSYCFKADGCTDDREKSYIGPVLYSKSDAIKDMISLKKKVDSVIIYFHWGEEYVVVQSTEEVKRAIETVQVYADVIVGDHGHVPAGHFFHNNTLVLENLGNFLYPMYQTKQKQVLKGIGNTLEAAKEVAAMMRRYRNPSADSMIVSLSFNRDGFDRKNSKYLPLKIHVNERNCLYVTKKSKNQKWKSFCTLDDPYCHGDNDCNVFNCKSEKKKKKLKVLLKEAQDRNK